MTLDLSILLAITGGYFLLILGAIVWSRLKSTGSITPGLSEYFLAGRNINAFVLLATYIGSLFSASFALALPGFVFTHGLGGGLFVIAGDMIGIIFMLSFYKQLREFSIKNETYSPIETISKGYGNRYLGLICSILMMIFLCPYISMQLVGVGKFLEGLTEGDIGYIKGVGAMMIVVALYLVFGGMRAVAYTDFVQTLCIFIGIFGSMAFFVAMNWGSIEAMLQETMIKSPEHLSLPGPQGFYNAPTFLSVSLFSLALLFQPHLLTRAMMAKDNKQINIMGFGLLIALLVGMLPVFIFGIGGAVLYGGEIESNQILGHVFKTITDYSFLGLIFTGFMLIGALGAAMSTADSILLAIGQIFARDVAEPFFKISQKSQILLSKFIMMAVLIGAFLMGLKPPQLMGELVLYSISATCILVPTFLGFQWKHRTETAAFASIAAGVFTLTTLAVTKTKLFDLHEGFVTLLVSGAVYYIIARLTSKTAQTLNVKQT